MPKKLKPVIAQILYTRGHDEDGEMFYPSRSDHSCKKKLLLDLTKDGRKILAEVICNSIAEGKHRDSYEEDAEAVLNALINLANEKP